jgi:Fe-S-cluster containining protein
MTEATCGGSCCAVFWLPENADWPKITDGAYVADMLIPLTRRQALRRWRKFVSTDKPLPKQKGGRTTFTCRHWDEKTRLCGDYENRPKLCRDYPYGQACSHGCSYQVDGDTAERYGNGVWQWDEEAKGWRPKSSTSFLWDAERGVPTPVPTEVPA